MRMKVKAEAFSRSFQKKGRSSMTMASITSQPLSIEIGNLRDCCEGIDQDGKEQDRAEGSESGRRFGGPVEYRPNDESNDDIGKDH